jgi:hypothetical protein
VVASLWLVRGSCRKFPFPTSSDQQKVAAISSGFLLPACHFQHFWLFTSGFHFWLFTSGFSLLAFHSNCFALFETTNHFDS